VSEEIDAAVKCQFVISHVKKMKKHNDEELEGAMKRLHQSIHNPKAKKCEGIPNSTFENIRAFFNSQQ
jgi:hypothetical protein